MGESGRFSRGALYLMLKNRIYRGEIVHKGKAFPGEHAAIVDEDLWRRAHAYALCRSNKGAPGVDGQDFEDIEAYGVERWLGELALALRQETYRPDPRLRSGAYPYVHL